MATMQTAKLDTGTGTIALGETREARPGVLPRRGVGFELRGRAAWGGGWLRWLDDQWEWASERLSLAASRTGHRLSHAGRAEASLWRAFAARLAVTTTEAELHALVVETAARLAGVEPQAVSLTNAISRAVRPPEDENTHALVVRLGGQDLAVLRVARRGSPRRCVEVRRRLDALAPLAAAGWIALREPGAPGEARSRPAAYRDEATGLPDLRTFELMLATALDQARRVHGKLAIVLIAPEGLAEIRHHDGDVFADAALSLAARAVRGTVRGSDPIARLDSDTLAVLLPGAAEPNARKIADSLRRAIAEAGQTASTPSPLTAAIGLAAYPGPALTPHALIALARKSLATRHDPIAISSPISTCDV